MVKSTAVIKREFYLQDTVTVARQLLGKILCVRTSAGIRRSRIVEVEAYLGLKDEACHSFGGRRTARTESMFKEGGHSYVYLIYGLHYCFNVVTGSPEHPEAVLIRAVEPLDVEIKERASKTELPTNGPGKLCRYYGINRKHNGLVLYSKKSSIWIEAPEVTEAFRTFKSKRIGVDSYVTAKDRLLRFSVHGNRFVSK